MKWNSRNIVQSSKVFCSMNSSMNLTDLRLINWTRQSFRSPLTGFSSSTIRTLCWSHLHTRPVESSWWKLWHSNLLGKNWWFIFPFELPWQLKDSDVQNVSFFLCSLHYACQVVELSSLIRPHPVNVGIQYEPRLVSTEEAEETMTKNDLREFMEIVAPRFGGYKELKYSHKIHLF